MVTNCDHLECHTRRWAWAASGVEFSGTKRGFEEAIRRLFRRVLILMYATAVFRAGIAGSFPRLAGDVAVHAVVGLAGRADRPGAGLRSRWRIRSGSARNPRRQHAGQAALALGKPRRFGRRFPRPGKRIGPLEAVDLPRAVVLDLEIVSHGRICGNAASRECQERGEGCRKRFC